MPKTFREFLNENKKEDVNRYDRLMLSANTHDRVRCAAFGDDKHRDHLIHDKNPWVRETVVIHGNDKHRDHLIHDGHPIVRLAIAVHGNERQANALAKDKHPQVRFAANRDFSQPYSGPRHRSAQWAHSKTPHK